MDDKPKVWVEFRGGPFDGAMTEIGQDDQGMVVYFREGPGERATGRGVYLRGGRIVGDLEVFSMEWSKEPEEDLNLL